MPNKWDIHQQAKYENLQQENTFVLKNRTITIHEVAHFWEFH
jgi:hypothetical protein